MADKIYTRPTVITRLSRELKTCLSRVDHVLRYRLSWVKLHDGSDRDHTMHAQRVDACQRVFRCLIEHMDVVTMIVGRGDDGHHYGLRLDTIAELTGLDLRRVDRVIRDLHAAGFLESWTRAEKKSYGYRAKTAIRQIPAAVLDLIGLGTALANAAAKAWAKRKKKKATQERPQRELDGVTYRNQVKHDRRGFKRASEPTTARIGTFLHNYSPG